MTRPEDRARAEIDRRLTQAGWLLQDMAQLDPSAGRGVAVREYPTDTGPADYLLPVDRQPVGGDRGQARRRRPAHHRAGDPSKLVHRVATRLGDGGHHRTG